LIARNHSRKGPPGDARDGFGGRIGLPLLAQLVGQDQRRSGVGAAAEHALAADHPAGAAEVRGVLGAEFVDAADLRPVLRAVEPVEDDRAAVGLGGENDT
jgi:hypothetical protein